MLFRFLPLNNRILSCMAKNIPVKKQHSWKTGLIVLRFKDAHSSNYNIFQEESCLHQRMLFPKYGSLSWKNITLCIQKNDKQLWRTYFTCFLHLRKYIVKRALHVQEGATVSAGCSFTYFNRMLYHFKRNALVEGSTHLKGMHHSFSRESFKVFEYVLTQGFEPTMSISK